MVKHQKIRTIDWDKYINNEIKPLTENKQDDFYNES